MIDDLIPDRLFLPLSWLLLLGALAGLGYSGYEVYRRHLQAPAEQAFSFGAVTRATSGQEVGMEQIINAHIFGVVPPKPAPKKEKPKVVEAPKTKLNLLLTGVVTSPDPEGGMAMIEIQRGQTSVVRVGADIGKTGASLREVFADHILIERQGALEKLPIERETLNLTDLAAGNDNTISQLNINVAEFEALAAVDPSETDISQLIPQARADVRLPDENDSDELKRQEAEQQALKEQMEEQQRLQQEAMEQQQQQLQQLQQQRRADPGDDQLRGNARPARRTLPTTLKQI